MSSSFSGVAGASETGATCIADAVERAVPIDGKDAGALAGEPPANQKHTLGSTVLWWSELPPLLLSTMASLVVL